jgi:excisionase family DNA binding protein
MAALSPKTDILVIEDVAKYLKVAERTIYRLAAAKRLPALEVGYR